MALVHEWLDENGGSEQVFRDLGNVFPGADRWALWSSPPWTDDPRLRHSWMQHSPLKNHKALALPFMPIAWRSLPTSGNYDVVISSSHCLAHTVKFRSPNPTVYLSYVHTPMRYAWLPELDQRGATWTAQTLGGAVRHIDLRMSRHVSSYAVNSQEIRRRVEEFWNRNATVIYPRVDTDFFHPTTHRPLPYPEYVLGVGRWIPYKRFDLVLAAAEVARLPVVLAGGGPEEDRLRAQARDLSVPVTFIKGPDRELLRDLYSGAVALIFPGHEDFGLVPVEAMACGTPVVGLDRGGLRETVVHGQGGWLTDDCSPGALGQGVSRVSTFGSQDVRKSVLSFGGDRFDEDIMRWVNSCI